MHHIQQCTVCTLCILILAADIIKIYVQKYKWEKFFFFTATILNCVVALQSCTTFWHVSVDKSKEWSDILFVNMFKILPDRNYKHPKYTGGGICEQDIFCPKMLPLKLLSTDSKFESNWVFYACVSNLGGKQMLDHKARTLSNIFSHSWVILLSTQQQMDVDIFIYSILIKTYSLLYSARHSALGVVWEKLQRVFWSIWIRQWWVWFNGAVSKDDVEKCKPGKFQRSSQFKMANIGSWSVCLKDAAKW